MPTDSQRGLAAAICDFLERTSNDGTVAGNDRDSIDVARQCIAEAFGVDADGADKPAVQLEQIYSVYERTKQASATKSQPQTTPAPAATATATGADDAKSAAAPTEKTGGGAGSYDAETVKKAEEFKSKGNAAMSGKDYDEAVRLYGEALKLVPDGKIYLSNRAAAHSSAGRHDLAIADAQLATEIDPNYGKAWSRLGHACFAKGALDRARQAYEKGVAVDPSSDVMRRGLDTVTKKMRERGMRTTSADDDEDAEDGSVATNGAGAGSNAAMPDFASLASMFGGGGAGGAGGAGGRGGMPDLSNVLNNPQFMQMANNLMSSGALDGFMRDPRMAQMAQNFMGGGGMPDLNDPEMQRMAEQMRRSMGGNGGGGSNSS